MHVCMRACVRSVEAPLHLQDGDFDEFYTDDMDATLACTEAGVTDYTEATASTLPSVQASREASEPWGHLLAHAQAAPGM